MVTFWENELEKSIKVTKMRIKICEKHGKGLNVMEEKRRLVKQQRQLELRKQK